jgi:hypothetical protein
MATKARSTAAAAVVEDIPHEVVTATTDDGNPQVLNRAIIVLTAEQKADQEVKRFDLARSWIAERKEKYKDLKIANLEDKEGYKRVEQAWQEIRNKRLAVQNKHKEIKADYLVITRKIDGEKNELIELLEEIENPLGAELDRIEEERKAKEREAERLVQEKLQGRVNELIAAGMAFNGSYYAIGETISIDVVTLKDMKDEQFGVLLGRVKSENEIIQAAIAKKAKEEQDERDRLAQQKIDQDAKALEIANKEKKLKEMRTKLRAGILESLGLKYDYTRKQWEFKNDFGHIYIPLDLVEGAEDEVYDISDAETELRGLKDKQADADKQKADKDAADKIQREKDEKEAQAKKDRFNLRVAELVNKFGMVAMGQEYRYKAKYPPIGDIFITNFRIDNANDWDWLEEISKLDTIYKATLKAEAQHEKELAQVAESNRISGLSDVQRLREYLEKVVKVSIDYPELKNETLRGAFKIYNVGVSSAHDRLISEIQKFENENSEGSGKGNN